MIKKEIFRCFSDITRSKENPHIANRGGRGRDLKNLNNSEIWQRWHKDLRYGKWICDPLPCEFQLCILLSSLFLFSQLFFFCYFFLYIDEPEQDSLCTRCPPVLRSSPWRIEEDHPFLVWINLIMNNKKKNVWLSLSKNFKIFCKIFCKKFFVKHFYSPFG